MSDLDDLRRQVEQLREQVHMEGGLRASQDSDLARLATRMDAARHLIQAVAITQSQHEEILRENTDRLTRLDERVLRLEQKTDAAAQQLQVIIGLLNQLIERG